MSADLAKQMAKMAGEVSLYGSVKEKTSGKFAGPPTLEHLETGSKTAVAQNGSFEKLQMMFARGGARPR